jgi:uncharacterized protein (TIGR02453 family)
MIENPLNNFPEKTIKYLKKLSKNNNREWFENHRNEYTTELLAPAIQFVLDMGEKLSRDFPQIAAIPKIDKSIFRQHRDVRFSKDKSPYKTNLGILLWEGPKKKMEASGFYFHVDPKIFFIGGGMYQFTKDDLKKYRELVYNPDEAKELSSIMKKIEKKKGFKIGGKTFKKVPRGFDKEYPFADLLLYEGIYAYYETDELNGGNLNAVNRCYKLFKETFPLHEWLVKNI